MPGFPSDGSGIPIANSALTDVGTRLISAYSDTSKECVLVKQNWDTYRKAVLRDGVWKFAKNTVSLTADNGYTAPFGFTTRYPLPADYVRLIAFNEFIANSDGGEPPYRIMGGYIHTNMSYCNIVYLNDVTDVKAFDPLFAEAFSAYIAWKLCNTLTGSPGGADALAKNYREALKKARFTNAVEDPSPIFDSDVWLQSRVGGPSNFRDPPFSEGSLLFP